MNLFDLHCDTIGECANRKLPLSENILHISLQKGKIYRPWFQVFAIWIPDELRGQKAYDYFLRIYEYFIEQIELNRQQIAFCRSAGDMRRVVSEEKCGAILSIEGGAAVVGDLEKLREAYDLGVRLMTLTWNGRNEIGAGSGVIDAGGLTDFGKQTVAEMEKMGMIIDVSHLSDVGFVDVKDVAKGSFVASHSNAREICGHKRNLTNEQIRVIVERKGLCGLNLCCDFLIHDNNHRSISGGCQAVLSHIRHFMALGAEKSLALGCDFDGTDVPDDLCGVDKMAILYEYLFNNGLNENLLCSIFYQNAFDYFCNILK